MKATPCLTIVSDPGVDDVLALVLLEKLAPKRKKTLVSSFGNCAFEVTDKNCRNFVAFMQNQWEYRPGARSPLTGKPNTPWATNYHGPDGLWDVQPPASALGPQPATSEAPGSVMSLAALTEPCFLLKNGEIQQLTIMGGAFGEPGNATPFSEYNIALDPEAAQQVFANCEGVDIQVVPLDSTNKVTWSLHDIQAIPETNAANRWLKQVLLAWFKNFGSANARNFALYDPLTVYLAFNPDAATWISSGVEVITNGRERGRTVLSTSNPACSIAMDVKKPYEVAGRIFSILFEDT